jgi:hypothetical protein
MVKHSTFQYCSNQSTPTRIGHPSSTLCLSKLTCYLCKGWGLSDLLLHASLLRATPLADIFTTLPSDCFAIDFPGRANCQARAFRFPPLWPGGEQADYPSLRASSDITVPSKLARLPSSGTVPVSGLTAAVERAHSDRARSGSKRPTRVLFRS